MRLGIAGVEICLRRLGQSAVLSWGNFRMHLDDDATWRKERGKIIAEGTEIERRGHRGRVTQEHGHEYQCHYKWIFALACLMIGLLAGCSRTVVRDPSSVRFLIEASPTNLDPRYGTDAFSQRIDRLIFNGLVKRDLQMNLQGDLAEKWESPDPLTYVFHLKPGIKFHDSRALTSLDVKATIEYMMNPANKSPKRGAFTMIDSIETPNAT